LPAKVTWKPGKWSWGKRVVYGKWRYVWASDLFVMVIRFKSGTRTIRMHGDKPEWGSWKYLGQYTEEQR
jgi:hypothetical protein